MEEQYLRAITDDLERSAPKITIVKPDKNVAQEAWNLLLAHISEEKILKTNNTRNFFLKKMPPNEIIQSPHYQIGIEQIDTYFIINLEIKNDGSFQITSFHHETSPEEMNHYLSEITNLLKRETIKEAMASILNQTNKETKS